MATSSPIKVPRPNHAPHKRNKVQSLVVPGYIQDISVEQFWRELYLDPNDFKQRGLRKYNPKAEFEKYMNTISKKVNKYAGLENMPLIRFCNTSATPPLDHPTGTGCKPDFSACPSSSGKHISWAEIDATIEIHSTGTSATEGPRQGASYTLYLLQSRPDRVSVSGMYVDAAGVVLILSSAESIKKSPPLDLMVPSNIRLVYAFVQRLYNPHFSSLDPTIKRHKSPNGGPFFFDITLSFPDQPSVECPGYTIMHALGSLGQRTHIFAKMVNPATINGMPIHIIKDQYQSTHHLDEAEIVHHIHTMDNEPIPEVIHITYAGDVRWDNGSSISCGHHKKTHICMSEYGTPFMDLKTPLEVLKAIYDLLEITRFMYFKQKVLHCDISEGNVLQRTKPGPIGISSASSHTTEDVKFCTIEHLLDPKTEKYATLTLLIDFDRGEILDEKDDEMHLERTGTPIFMARAVRAGGPLGEVGDYSTYKMPKLLEVAEEAYERVFPNRLKRFQTDVDRIGVEIREGTSSWRHELCHDAESAYWLLVWWAVHALPQDGPITEIPASVWNSLTDTTVDNRGRIANNSLDPAYAKLEGLLRMLWGALQFDLHWADQEPYTHPDFLHEVFQRHLLNFILDNHDQDFMTLPKANARRKPMENTAAASLMATPQIEQSRSKRSRDPEPQASASKKLKSTWGRTMKRLTRT